ncbi:MAG: DUF2254 domain-containing protein [Chlamydiia bacterium]|nr:DUF2254 domain-containing protein [Chlamydiia bacterium]
MWNKTLGAVIAAGLFGALLAVALFWMDSRLGGGGSASGALTLLSTLLAAIVTVWGILLSILMSSLIRTAQQYGPTVLSLFRASTPPKILLVFMTFTVSYLIAAVALILLAESRFVPLIASETGVILVFVAVMALPLFFLAATRLLEPAELASRLAEELRERVEAMDPLEQEERARAKNDDENTPDLENSLRASKTGYIQQIDREALMTAAEEGKRVLVCPVREGEFVLEGTPVLHFEGKEPELPKNWVLQAHDRSGERDLELSIERLLSIVVRALSPGINDLFTAIRGINHIGESCNTILNKRFPRNVRSDNEGKLFTKEFDFEGFMFACMDPLRENCAEQPLVSLHLLGILKNLEENCAIEQRKDVIRKNIKLIAEDSYKNAVNDREKQIFSRFKSLD